MHIRYTNSWIWIQTQGDSDSRAVEELREATKYFVEGAKQTDAFASGHWDGFEYLVRPARGLWKAPIGLLSEIRRRWPSVDEQDERQRPGIKLRARLNPDEISGLRSYQSRTVDLALDPKCGFKGLIQLPPRAGKTIIAAAITAKLGCRTVFIVNSDMLLRQTVKTFEKVIEWQEPTPNGMPFVGQWGGGVQKPGWVTVASVQSLIRLFPRKKKRGSNAQKELAPGKKLQIEDMLDMCGLAFFDECHHLEGDEWRKAMMRCNAFHKYGLSATIYMDRTGKGGGTHKGTIWLLGATGPRLVQMSASDLIRLGWLCRVEVNFVPAPHPRLETAPEILRNSMPDLTGSWHAVYREGIVENAGRNRQIARVAAYERRRGNRVLITLQHTKHCSPLGAELTRAGLIYATVIGKTPAKNREGIIEGLHTGEIDVVMGTVFGEAVDIPWLEVVIIADGGSSKVRTMQRLRNMTACGPDGRPTRVALLPPPIVRTYDFVDAFSPVLKRHTLARLQAYREEPEFLIKWRRDL